MIIKGNKFGEKILKEIFVGAGKCAAEAAAALERILGDRITDSIVLSLSEEIKKIKSLSRRPSASDGKKCQSHGKKLSSFFRS